VKSALRSVLIALLLIVPIVAPDVAHVIGFSGMNRGESNPPQISHVASTTDRVFLNQTFDNENTGAVPKDWYITSSQYGNVTVDGAGFRGKCAMIIDNSTGDNPSAYRYFAEQTNTVGIAFAIKPTSNAGPNANIEIFIDDGNFNGANIIFTNGKIAYRTDSGLHDLRTSYVSDRWYNIKMILNIPANTYNIHIDDHLEKIGADFIGTCKQLHRIVFNNTGGQDGSSLPVAYFDELWGRLGIEIPRGYSTIQEGINKANDGDLLFVTGKRTYYESVIISKSICLVGEDICTTIINGGLVSPEGIPDGISIPANDVCMYGFTIRATRGVGIRVQGSNNTIEDNNVTGGLSDGMYVSGSGNYFAGNIITNNNCSGIQVIGSNCTLINNTISSNDLHGIFVSGSDCAVYDNLIKSSRDRGILIFKGNRNLIRNNTITSNGIGLECDAETQNNRIYQNRFVSNEKKPQALEHGNNQWDDGYPYIPDDKTGGGNYWSDFDTVDVYSGANQDLHACFLTSDGISDEPYHLTPQVQDRYPLFLIQNVTQDHQEVTDLCHVTYTIECGVSVKVNAAILENVSIESAFLLVDYDSSSENITMTFDAQARTLAGTIPPKKFGTQVKYRVSIHANLALEVNSTYYPLTGPYSVNDFTAPSIDNIVWAPSVPDDNQTVRVWAHVVDTCSGVSGVFLSYKFNDTWWIANMAKTDNDNYKASMPKQPGNMTVSFNVSAVDMVGNRASRDTLSIQVVRLPELSVTNATNPNLIIEPCDIDLGIMYRGQKITDSNLTICNKGQENMAWNIIMIKDGDWLKSILPSTGVLQPGKCATVLMTIDTTTCLDPNLYVAELSVNANGSVPRWVVLLRFIVRDIVIDDSWCSMPAPQRSDLNETQYLAFHTEWTHNCADAASGKIRVNSNGTMTDWLPVNGTGWAVLPWNPKNPGLYIFNVVAVDFIYVDNNPVYHITSFTQKAASLTVIWDRVNLVLRVTDDRIDVDNNASVTWVGSVYESDNSPFVGNPILNDTLNKHTVGRYCFTASSVNDTKYGLTVFQSNLVFCIWDEIKVNVGGVSNKQTQVGKPETVWVLGIYEYDNMLLKGANGTLYLDVYVLAYDGSTQRWAWVWNRTDPMDWSSLYDRWEKTYSFDDLGPRRFTVSKSHPVEDRLYNLTAVNDLVVPPLDVTWLGGGWAPWPDPLPDLPTDNASGTIPFPVQGSLEIPFWAISAIIVTLAIGLVLIFAIIVVSGKQRTRKSLSDHVKDGPIK